MNESDLYEWFIIGAKNGTLDENSFTDKVKR